MSTSNDQMVSPNDTRVKEFSNVTEDTRVREGTFIDGSHSSGNPSTLATAGTPGFFNNDIPTNLATLNSLGALGNTDAWTTGQWIVLMDASEAYWDASVWVAGKAPA